MNLLSIQIKNAFSFGEATINFSQLGTHTQILGINYDEDNSGSASNGAGKTSIFLCLTECLFGKNIKNIKKDSIPNNSVNNGYSITTCFSVGNILYKVVNSRDNKNKATVLLYKDSVDVSEHTIPGTYKLVQSIIGMDYTLFCKLIYQSSANYLDFLTITDSDRKKLLINLFNLGEQSGVILLVKDRVNEWGRELLKVRGIQSKLLSETKIIVENKNRLLELPDSAFTAFNRITIAELSVKIDNISRDNIEIQKHKKLLLECENFPALEEVEEVPKDILDNLMSKISSTRNKLKNITEELNRYKSTPTVCHVCGQPIQRSFSEDKIPELENIVLGLNDDLSVLKSKCEDNLAKQNAYNNYVASYKDQMRKLQCLNTTLASKSVLTVDTYQKEIDDCTRKIRVYEAEVEYCTSENLRIAAHNSKQDTLEDIRNTALRKLTYINKEVLATQDTLDTYKQLHTALEKLLVFTLENMVISLQQAVNSYINYLFSSDIALVISMNKDKLSFTIMKEGNVVEVGSLSTGELSRVQVSVLLAIRDVLTSMSGTNIDILILDEILSSLDEPGRTGLYTLLEKVPYKVLSISHSYTDNRLDNLTIKKRKGKSTIWL